MSTEKGISKLPFVTDQKTDSDYRDEYAAYLDAVIDKLENDLYVDEDKEVKEKLDEAITDLENL